MMTYPECGVEGGTDKEGVCKEAKCPHTLIMTLQRLQAFPVVHVPYPDGLVSTSGRHFVAIKYHRQHPAEGDRERESCVQN